MQRNLAPVLLLVLSSSSAFAQAPSGIVRIEVRAGNQPVADAEVVMAGVTHRTDAAGLLTISAPAGTVEFVVVKEGFLPATATTVSVVAGLEQSVIVELQTQPTIEEHVTVVATTRTEKRLEDQPMRVEVLDREEIEEKMLMTPGDIVMMLNEMGGMRVQATSPSLGAASVRIQGMRGRYTRFFSDGLPLFGEVDAGAVGQTLFRQRYLVSARAAVVQQRHDHRFGEIRERDRHDTAFGEITLRATAGRHTLVGGLAIERDAYRPRDLPQFKYTFTVPGAFVQDDLDVTKWLSLSASGRLDRHNEYGTFFSPRVSALLRSGMWNSRLSLGTGFFGPTPLTEETEAAGLSRLSMPQSLQAEKGRSASLDLSRTDGPASYTLTLFASHVRHPIDVDRSNGLVLTNLSEPATNVGVELLGTVRREPFALTATYTYVRSRELDAGALHDTPLTPRHSAGIVGMWERRDVGRVGVEVYHTGVQSLEENPYRDASEPYVIIGLLVERLFGRVRLFINGENLSGVRQTRSDPLIRPNRAPDGRWTVDAWAPLEGRNMNGGVRVTF